MDDMTYLGDHYSELLRKYENKWVAIVNSKVVSSGTSANDVYTEAKKKFPTIVPFITYVTDMSVTRLA